jgi:hypothetical protein
MNVEKRGTQVMAKFLSFGEGENLCKFIKLYFLEYKFYYDWRIYEPLIQGNRMVEK